MDVSQILSLLGTLSIGLDDPTDSDIVVYLRFLNLCYNEILQETLSQSTFVPIVSDVLDCIDGVVSPTSQTLFIPKVIYDIASNVPLSGTTYDTIMKEDPGLTNVNAPLQWYMSGGQINTYPVGSSLIADGGGIGVKYIAQPTPLIEATASEDILIPPMYQHILADGAAYYLFQSESGFKDQAKMLSSMQRWTEGKQKLFAYYKNMSGKKYYSTYSSV